MGTLLQDMPQPLRYVQVPACQRMAPDLSLTSWKALVHLKPKRITIRDGSLGVHNITQVYCKINPAVVSDKWLRLGWID